MRAIPAIVFIFLLSSIALSEDLVLVNGTVIDGTGKPRFAANVRIRDDKIADLGPLKPGPDERVLDVRGMVIAPGFIDIQSLSVAAIGKDPVSATTLLAEGVTTAVLGSDGTGPYSIEDFMQPFDEKPTSMNIALLVGHATIRRQIMGQDFRRAATADELKRMGELVSDAMKQGAFGFASDLQQEPASFSSQEELLTLAKIVAKFGGTVVLHPRDAKEAVSIARDGKVAVQVLNADKTTLLEIDRARAQRVDISADRYSYPQLVQDKGVALERAIQRMTATPASRIGLRERGVLKKGAPADLVIFNPMSLSSGLKYVFVNGAIASKDGEPTAARSGAALR
jgi:N-acyl-D-amino-acid deacylase